VLVATSNATAAATHITALIWRMPFLRGMNLFIVVPFLIGAARRILVQLTSTVYELPSAVTT
jgi:hypothetical protein